jgi:hypothetical protein
VSPRTETLLIVLALLVIGGALCFAMAAYLGGR